MKKVILLSILFALRLADSFALNSDTTKVYARPYGDSIALRWHPYDIPLWEKNILRGYDVYRKGANGQVVKINDSTIKAFDEHQFAFRYLKYPKPLDSTKDESLRPEDFKFLPDTAAIKAYSMMFPDKVGLNFKLPSKDEPMSFGDDPLVVRWMFHSITCLTSKEAAYISGLYFIDKKVKKGERYTYYITTAGAPWTKALGSITVASTDNYPIHAPKGITDFTNKRHAHVSWKKADTANVYIPSYEIYRSDKKNGTYVRMNKLPILAIMSGKNQRDSTVVFYGDSTVKKGQTYYYKMRGLDVFGDYSPYSEPYQVTEKTLIESAPFIEESGKVEKPISCRIKWYVFPSEEENIHSFQVYKSTKPDTLFRPYSEVLKKDQRIFIDKNPTKNNYYKVMTLGKAGDTLWTSPTYVLVPDTIPPLPATMLKATCDSNGVVTLVWKHNNEPDLHSFKLYRANYKHEEFSRVATIERVDTTYRDTVNLATLTESIFYKIIAYDDSYNPSAFSNVIQVKRYDTIAPTNPVFYTFRSDTAGIALTWANSSSEDVVKTVLYRKLKEEASWHEFKVFAGDTADYTTFVDKKLFKGNWYEYTLRAFDDDKNVSDYAQPLQVRAHDDGFRPEILTVESNTNIRKHTVKLSWKYPHSGVQLFQIYRGTNDKPLTILKSVDSQKFEYYDLETGAGNKYIYRIKAVFRDGGESPFTKEIIVQF